MILISNKLSAVIHVSNSILKVNGITIYSAAMTVNKGSQDSHLVKSHL